jgi:hypothetical protein
MTKSETKRRAGEYRNRALQLENRAAKVRDAADRRHMLELAATLRRAADAMAPVPRPSEADLVFRSPHAPIKI